MLQYTVRRLLSMVLVLALVVVLVFVLLTVLPGDGGLTDRLLSLGLSLEEIDAIKERRGLNDPLYERFFHWAEEFLSGDFGISGEELRRRLGNTFELGALALLLSTVVAIPAGIGAAVWRNSSFDYLARFTIVLGSAVPNFVLGVVVILLMSKVFHYAPPIGYVAATQDLWRNVQQIWIPVLVLAAGPAAELMRFTRSSMLTTLQQEYVRTARAKGLLERQIVMVHAARTALLPVLTVLGLQVGGIIAGSVVMEVLFNLPGLGLFFLGSVLGRNVPVTQSLVVLFGLFILTVNLVVDLAYAWLDPRIRY